MLLLTNKFNLLLHIVINRVLFGILSISYRIKFKTLVECHKLYSSCEKED